MNDTSESASFPDGTIPLPEHDRVKKSSLLRPRVLAERLRAVRLAARLTQQELAGKRFSKGYISAIERGKLLPSLQSLEVLAETLAVPVSYLLGEIEIDKRALEESNGLVYAVTTQDAPIDEGKARQRLGTAEVFIRQDRPEEAWAQLGESDEPPAGWPLHLRPHWAWLSGWTLFLLGRPADAVRCLEQGMRLASSLRLRAPRAQYAYWDEMIEWVRCFLGVANCAQGKKEESLQYYLLGLEGIEQKRARDPELKLWIYKGLGNEYFAHVRYQEAIGWYQKALAEVKNCNNKRQHGLAAWGLARIYQQQGDFFRAKTAYGEALQALGEHGNLQLLGLIRALYGLVLTNLEEFAEAERQLQKSLDNARRVNDPHARGIALAYLAFLYNARGEPDRAIQEAQGSFHLVQQSGDRRALAHLLFTLVAAYTAKKDWAAVEQVYREAIQLGEQIPDYEMLAQAHQGYADFLADQARFQEACQELALVGAGVPEPAKI